MLDGREKDSQPEGRSGEGNPARCSSQGPPQGDPSRMEPWVGGFYPKMPPMVEAMMMPRITQQMMIMIFFCRDTKGRPQKSGGRDWNEGSCWG